MDVNTLSPEMEQMNKNTVRKNRSANWSQQDTDFLCNLVRELGLKSVLNSRTNGTTNEIKKADWISIADRFNSHPLIATQRNVEAIIARYKKVMQALRNYFAEEKRNVRETGGGPSSVPKIEITGSMLELKAFYGHLLTGLPSFDSDEKKKKKLDEPRSSLKDCCNSQKANESSKAMEIEMSLLLAEDEFKNDSPNEKEESVEPESILPPEIVLETSKEIDRGHNVPTYPPARQFFATNLQRRRRLTNGSVDEKRLQLVEEERMKVDGDLRAKFYQAECEARLDEIKQRKEQNLALHRKQMEFWNIAIKKINCEVPNDPTAFKDSSPQIVCQVRELVEDILNNVPTTSLDPIL